jgi:hypothetical protein
MTVQPDRHGLAMSVRDRANREIHEAFVDWEGWKKWLQKGLPSSTYDRITDGG